MKTPKGRYQNLCGPKEERVYTTLDSVEANTAMNRAIEQYFDRFRGTRTFNEWYEEFLKELQAYDSEF